MPMLGEDPFGGWNFPAVAVAGFAAGFTAGFAPAVGPEPAVLDA